MDLNIHHPINTVREYLRQRPDVRKILANTGWLFSDSVLRLILAVLVSAWVARYLGAEQYGQLNLALAYSAIIGPIAALGLDNVLVRRFVTEDQHGKVLGTAFYLRLVCAILVSAPLLLIVNALHSDQPVILALMLLMVISRGFQALEVLRHWFNSQVEARSIVIARNLSFFTISALKVVAILQGSPLIVFGLLYALDIVFFMFLLLWSYRRGQRKRGLHHRWAVDWDYGRSLLRESWPLILGGLAVTVYMRIDQIMLGQLLPVDVAERSVGVYAAAVRVSEMWYFVPLAIVTSTFPALLQSKQRSEHLYHKRLQRLFNLLVLVAYSVAIPMTILSGFIINLLYGAEYADAAPALIVLVWAGVWVSMGYARAQVLIAEDATVMSMWASVAGAAVNVALNWLMIPAMGVLGSAIATLVSQIVAAHLSTLLVPRVRQFGIMQTKALVFPNPFNRYGKANAI